MIILDSTSKSLCAVLAGGVSANQPIFTVAYADTDGTTFTEAGGDGVLNSTTEVELIAAPAADHRRIVKYASIYNADTAQVTVSLYVKNGASVRIIKKKTLASGASLEFGLEQPLASSFLPADVGFSATDKLLGRSTAGAGAGEEIACTAAGRALLDDAAASNQKTTLGLGSDDSPTFAGLTVGSLAGFLFGTAGAVSALASSARIKTVNDTHNIATTGTQAITGVGFTPSFVFILASVDDSSKVSLGLDNGTVCGVIGNAHGSNVNTWANRGNYSIFLIQTGSDFATALITSLDEDGFTLTWSKTGSPTGTTAIYAVCFR